MSPSSRIAFLLLFSAFLSSCKTNYKDRYAWVPMEVTVSAYNSVRSQTDGLPTLAAWGDTLRPGMKCIAVSRDLVSKGLGHNTQVKIEGLEGIYLVKDKMHARWSKRIDLYMGSDVQRAREWGRRKLTIHYAMPKETQTVDSE